MVLTEAVPVNLSRQRRRGWPFFVGLVLLAVVVAYVLAFKVPEWRNDEKLARFEERVSMAPYPPDTEPGDRPVQGVVGLQSGNSNHCDFAVRLSLLTKLPDAEIARYYESLTVEGVEGRRVAGSVFVNPSGSWRAGYKSVIVEFLDGFHEPGRDWRCH
ncbi:hypothetical protein DMB42_24595 [Nonomuraea sp. WAC 01424]|uniref:hypothetical protein n=1 Tax=Nonomuraea sp. WAC 01424 TaxID=2203200 RepID=UPI000F774323|nr:hypothetical protein [Nonomuraea sp. WAC 01424]RSN06471.1 hypothetical protein DMB42_24595 [Nonomuraea sp. WAC 01424]